MLLDLLSSPSFIVYDIIEPLYKGKLILLVIRTGCVFTCRISSLF